MSLVRQLITLPLYFQPLSVHIEPHGVVVMVPAHTEFVSCEVEGKRERSDSYLTMDTICTSIPLLTSSGAGRSCTACNQ